MFDYKREAEDKMKKSIEVLKDDLLSIRAGRANPALLDKITVEYYGQVTLSLIHISEPTRPY